MRFRGNLWFNHRRIRQTPLHNSPTVKSILIEALLSAEHLQAFFSLIIRRDKYGTIVLDTNTLMWIL